MLDLAVVDLAARPDLAGQVVYLFAQARVLLPKTSLDLAADVGAGWQRSSGFEANEAKDGWRVFGYQVTLPRASHGKVTLGLQVVSESGAAHAPRPLSARPLSSRKQSGISDFGGI